MIKKNNFLTEKVEQFKKQKNIKKHQKIILDLGEKKDLNNDEKKMLNQAIKFEKSLQIMKKEKQKLNIKFKEEKEREKKAENEQLIKQLKAKIDQLKPIITILEKCDVIDKNTGKLLITEDKLLQVLSTDKHLF